MYGSSVEIEVSKNWSSGAKGQGAKGRGGGQWGALVCAAVFWGPSSCGPSHPLAPVCYNGALLSVTHWAWRR